MTNLNVLGVVCFEPSNHALNRPLHLVVGNHPYCCLSRARRLAPTSKETHLHPIHRSIDTTFASFVVHGKGKIKKIVVLNDELIYKT